MPDAEIIKRGKELFGRGWHCGNSPAGGLLLSQRTEEVKDDAHPIDRGARHCRRVISCRPDAGRRGALVRKHSAPAMSTKTASTTRSRHAGRMFWPEIAVSVT